MRTLRLLISVALAAAPALIATPPALGQPAPRFEAPPDGPLDAAAKKAAVEGLAQSLRKTYVFPDIGERYAASLLRKLATGGYRETTAAAFADAINKDLQAIRKDGHLRVRFDPAFHPPADPDAEPTPAEKAAFRKRAARFGFGVEKVERLPGNVGLLDLRGFLPTELSAGALSAAMSLVASSDALIIDLRQNGGGDPETVALLCTYLFPDDKPVHVNDIYNRPKNETRQYWTQASVPAPRYVGKPVYVVTSARTFSGAEEFSYDLQVLKRATLVGETTGGGAHPGDMISVGGGFVAFVPTGRAINPITRTNWEGVGVKPDIAAPAPQALQTAHLTALRGLLKAEQDGERRAQLERAIIVVEKGEPSAPARP
jgi:Peptidase family S41/N-terminal domain of Peptidase_S41 in eukaryotic IRBP